MCVDLAGKETVSEDIAHQQRMEEDFSEGSPGKCTQYLDVLCKEPVASLLWCPLDALLTTLSDPSLPTLPRESWGPPVFLLVSVGATVFAERL